MIAAARRILARLRRPARTSSSQQREIFTAIFRRNDWGHPDSVSGPGSTIERGLQFRDELVKVLRDVEIKSILDAPCGDFNWMRLVLDDLDVEYTGVDIVEALVRENAARDARQFRCLDFTADELPRADLVLCRDALVHFSFADIHAAIGNFQRSGARYLMATTFVDRDRNRDIATGGWRPLNMQLAPFSFPEPVAIIDEQCMHSGGIYRDKRLALWKLDDKHA